jgi:hypothetical protein
MTRFTFQFTVNGTERQGVEYARVTAVDEAHAIARATKRVAKRSGDRAPQLARVLRRELISQPLAC